MEVVGMRTMAWSGKRGGCAVVVLYAAGGVREVRETSR